MIYLLWPIHFLMASYVMVRKTYATSQSSLVGYLFVLNVVKKGCVE